MATKILMSVAAVMAMAGFCAVADDPDNSVGRGSAWREGPSEEWFVDWDKALDAAKKSRKAMFLLNTGSDWCGWCKKLRAEVLDKPEFAEFARDIALQVAALAPRWLDDSEIPADIVESEKALYLQQLEADPKNANKPEKIKEGIISGKFRKFAAENCLVDQEFVKISKTSIKQHAANVGKALGDTLTIRRYTRFQLGQH